MTNSELQVQRERYSLRDERGIVGLSAEELARLAAARALLDRKDS